MKLIVFQVIISLVIQIQASNYIIDTSVNQFQPWVANSAFPIGVCIPNQVTPTGITANWKYECQIQKSSTSEKVNYVMRQSYALNDIECTGDPITDSDKIFPQGQDQGVPGYFVCDDIESVYAIGKVYSNDPTCSDESVSVPFYSAIASCFSRVRHVPLFDIVSECTFDPSQPEESSLTIAAYVNNMCTIPLDQTVLTTKECTGIGTMNLFINGEIEPIDLYVVHESCQSVTKETKKKTQSKKFTLDDLEDFRILIIDEIKAQESGLTYNHPLVSDPDGMITPEHPFSFFFGTDQPMIASLIRNTFHDCSGFNIYKNNYDCDGCIKRTAPDHSGLFEGAIEPIEYICDFFKDKLSTADCWALAATVAVEVAGANIVTTPFRGFVGLNPDTADIFPGDIPYLIGRKDCRHSPDTAPDFEFIPFKATDGWRKISEDAKNRFGLTNQEVVALIGGGHSVGRGHLKVSGFISAFDATTDALDNAFFTELVNVDPFAKVSMLEQDWFQAKLIDFPENIPECEETPECVAIGEKDLEANEGNPSIVQWLNYYPETLRELGIAGRRHFFGLHLNSDISMAYDLSKYVDNGLHNEIECHTDAFSICGNKFVLIDGFEEDPPSKEEICEFKQCPLQCPDGKGGFERFQQIVDNNKLYDVDENDDCIRAFVEQFARDNAYFSKVFVRAFTKMITTGYKDDNQNPTLYEVGSDSSDDDSNDNDGSADDSSDEIAAKLNRDILKDNTQENSGYTKRIVISFDTNSMIDIWTLVIGVLAVNSVIAWCYCFRNKKNKKVIFEDEISSKI